MVTFDDKRFPTTDRPDFVAEPVLRLFRPHPKHCGGSGRQKHKHAACTQGDYNDQFNPVSFSEISHNFAITSLS